MAKSPYTKKEKTPHKYSETYRKWKAALDKGDQEGIVYWGKMHTMQFGPRHPVPSTKDPLWPRKERYAKRA